MFKRIISALFLSAGVTFCLFFVMQILVSGNEEVRLDTSTFRFIDVVQNVPEQEIRRKEVEVEKPPEVEAPPEEAMKQVTLDGPSALDLSIGRDNLGGGIDMGSMDLSLTSDGEYLPLVRMEPQYPRRAAERGLEGWVTVEFTVTADGTVINPFIIDSGCGTNNTQCTTFNSASIKAVKKFKYKPKVVNGVAQAVDGVRTRFTFQMDKSKNGRR